MVLDGLCVTYVQYIAVPEKNWRENSSVAFDVTKFVSVLATPYRYQGTVRHLILQRRMNINYLYTNMNVTLTMTVGKQ
jgi:hypothetical protein